MKRITYKKLMKNCEEGKMEVTAWSGDYAEVMIFPSDLSKPPKREHMEVTNIPDGVRVSWAAMSSH